MQFLMSRHLCLYTKKDLAKKGDKLKMQREELAAKPLPDGKTQEEKENEEMSSLMP